MIKSNINIDDYWNIIAFIDIDYNKYKEIAKELIHQDADIKTINKIYKTISNKYNSAFTYTNSISRTSVVGINKTTSRRELINSISHEADHIQYSICKYYNVPLGSEDAAYLLGHLVERLYISCSHLLCYY